MASVAELRLLPAQLSFRVLQMDPVRASAEEAAQAVGAFLQRKRLGLAQALQISSEGPEIVIRVSGEEPEQMLREAEDMLGLTEGDQPAGEMDVQPDDFAIEVIQVAQEESRLEREVLRSRVRYFPCPVCEWFEMSTGDLVLSDQRLVYEPEWVVMTDDQAGSEKQGLHSIPLAQIAAVYRGEWWDVPCLMVETPARTYRYGWPAERDEPAEFDVDEWMDEIRLLQRPGE
jgi:hypothetical protein